MAVPNTPVLGVSDFIYTPIVSGIQTADPEWKPFWVYYGSLPEGQRRHQSRKSFLLALQYYKILLGQWPAHRGLYGGLPGLL